MKPTLSPTARRRIAKRVRQLLHARFPLAFAGHGEPKRPLSVGIGLHVLLQMPEIGMFDLSIGLDDYTSGDRYLEACVSGAPRVHIMGFDDGFVTEADAAHAAQRLAALRSHRAAAPVAAPERTAA